MSYKDPRGNEMNQEQTKISQPDKPEEQLSQESDRKVFYLCDGNVPECEKTCCYKTNVGDGWCKHTSNIEHALNFEISQSGRCYFEKELSAASENMQLTERN